MAEYTANYNLKKPGINDNALIKDVNENMDIIDGELKSRAPLDAHNRVPVANAPLVYKELVRFTASGTFRPSSYPTADGRYDIILQGGGGSGAQGSIVNGATGGESGGFMSLHAIPLLQYRSYAVVVGKGGTPVGYDVTGAIGFKEGRQGGATVGFGYSVPGGQGGQGSGGEGWTPTVSNGYTQNLGTAGTGGSGGDSNLAAGGANNYSGQGGGNGSLGSGGGAGDGSYGEIRKSGAGGDGVVIISGWVGGR